MNFTIFFTICFSVHDPCDPNPCWKGNCSSVIAGDFNCSCPLYVGGKRCITSTLRIVFLLTKS